MPISACFKGSGEKVLKSMQSEYGAKKGKSVFYATANSKNMSPKTDEANKAALNVLGTGKRKAKI